MGSGETEREFFTRVIDVAGVPAEEILYVGDRVDNDVIPARASGLRTALVRRGPWGYLHAERPEAAQADVIVSSLTELTEWLTARLARP